MVKDLPETEQQALALFDKHFGRPLEQTGRVCDKNSSVSALYVIKNRHVAELALNYDPDPYWGCEVLTAFPEEILTFSHLEWLWLEGQKIDEIPKSIGSLINLKHLSFAYNSIWELPEDIGTLLPVLEQLWMTGNKLRYLPDSMRHLKHLRHLYLSQNKLTDLPDWLVELPRLELVTIDNNDAIFCEHYFSELEARGVKVITCFIDD
jgi:Leucine-rich repeat (LRR) protein